MAQEQWVTRYTAPAAAGLVTQLDADIQQFAGTRLVQQLVLVERGNLDERGQALLTLIALWAKKV